MKNILDEPPITPPPAFYSYYASLAVLVLAGTVAIVILGIGSNSGTALHNYIYIPTLVINFISTLIALVASVFALTHREPETGRTVICLLFSMVTSFFWVIALVGALSYSGYF